MQSLTELDFFLTLCREGSMSNAARVLDISPAAVSKRLANIEKRLKIQLFNRSTRSMSLTPEGQIYQRHAEQTLSQVLEMEEQLSRHEGQVRGRLKVNAPLGFGRKYMAPIVSGFVQAYPQVEVTLHLSDIPHAMVDGAFDVAIRFGELPDSNLHARKIASHRRIVCASPHYLARHGCPQHPDELANHECITLHQNRDSWSIWKFQGSEETCSVKVGGSLSTNDGESALRWALDGRGIVLRAEWDVAPYVEAGELKILFKEYQLPNADIHLVYQHHAVLPLRIHHFIEHTQGYLARHPFK